MKAWYYWAATYNEDGDQTNDVRCVIHAPTRGLARAAYVHAFPDCHWLEAPTMHRSPQDDTPEEVAK